MKNSQFTLIIFPSDDLHTRNFSKSAELILQVCLRNILPKTTHKKAFHFSVGFHQGWTNTQGVLLEKNFYLEFFPLNLKQTNNNNKIKLKPTNKPKNPKLLFLNLLCQLVAWICASLPIVLFPTLFLKTVHTLHPCSS